MKAEFWVPDAQTVARLESIRDFLHRTMPFVRRPRRPGLTP